MRWTFSREGSVSSYKALYKKQMCLLCLHGNIVSLWKMFWWKIFSRSTFSIKLKTCFTWKKSGVKFDNDFRTDSKCLVFDFSIYLLHEKKAIYKWCWFLFKIKFTLHHFGQCYIASLRPVFTFDHVVFDFSENVFDHVLVEKHFSENVFRQERDRKHGSEKNPLELGLWMNRAHVFPAY